MYHIIVRTKYQSIFNNFLKTFLETTKGFDIKLYVVHRAEDNIVVPDITNVESCLSTSLGNTAFKPILNRILKETKITVEENNYGYFGIFNDDLVFSDRWLMDVNMALSTYPCVSPGYVNTDDIDRFNKRVEATKNDYGYIPLAVGSCMVMRLNVFPRIGMLDTQFDWACDDLDLILRLKLNGMMSVTSKKITIAHLHGASRTKEMARWNVESEAGKMKFYEKHGIVNYRNLVEEYKRHKYFIEYEN